MSLCNSFNGFPKFYTSCVNIVHLSQSNFRGIKILAPASHKPFVIFEI